MKVFFKYYKDHFSYNIAITIALTITYLMMNSSAILKQGTGNINNFFPIIINFSFIFLIPGFIGSIFSHNLLQKNEKYFYYNLGLSDIKLNFVVFISNIILVLSVCFLFIKIGKYYA